jgi:hypothetical protein
MQESAPRPDRPAIGQEALRCPGDSPSENLMRLIAVVSCLLLATGSSLAHAASESTKAAAAPAAKEKAATMTAEEKAASRKRTTSKWESMTPEQKGEARKRHAEQRSERAADTGSSKEKQAGKPAADLPPPSAGPR